MILFYALSNVRFYFRAYNLTHIKRPPEILQVFTLTDFFGDRMWVSLDLLCCS